MRKPDFIGIGVQKGGTSWLHQQLLHHPEIYVPAHRKEIHFFDVYYDRGLEWYLKWFENSSEKAAGEITPDYIYLEQVHLRIKQDYPDMRFIVMLRDPVKRAYSHYQMIFQSGDGQKYKDFNDFMENHPHGYRRGLYNEQLKRWFQAFPQEQFLILISEEIFNSEEGLKKSFERIGKFLSVDPNLFDKNLAKEKVGAARKKPTSGTLARLAQKGRIFLRDHDLDSVAVFFKNMGVTRELMGKSSEAIPPLSSADRERWRIAYDTDIKNLADLIGRDLTIWS